MKRLRPARWRMVRYLLDKGANPELVDAEGHKPIDVIGAGGRGGPAGATPAAGRGAAGRGGPGGGGASVSPATAAEIRALLENAAAKK